MEDHGGQATHWRCDCNNVNHATRKSCLDCGKVKPKEPKWIKSHEF